MKILLLHRRILLITCACYVPMFGVGNLRATISDVKPMLEAEGYSVVRTTGRKGETRYGVTS